MHTCLRSVEVETNRYTEALGFSRPLQPDAYGGAQRFGKLGADSVESTTNRPLTAASAGDADPNARVELPTTPSGTSPRFFFATGLSDITRRASNEFSAPNRCLFDRLSKKTNTEGEGAP